MIKTTVKQPSTKVKSYPKLMKSRETGKIVLFLSECRGQVLVNPESTPDTPLGYFGTNWDSAHFEDFEGTLTLEND